MADKINFSLITNNKESVKNISNCNFVGIKGEGSNRAQEVNTEVIKDTLSPVSHITGITYVARDFNKLEIEPSQQKTNDQGDQSSPQNSSNKFALDQSNANSYYITNFEVLNKLGTGGFGQVFKVKDKVDDQIYAIKKVIFRDSDPESIDFVLREVKTLAQISSDKVVRYFNAWLEINCLFIKMEFCSDDLNNTIHNKRDVFQRPVKQLMDVIEYHISCQLLKELLECVRFLHELSRPIIHRDLKPHNILISQKPINGKYLKLCDFGLAVVHDNPLLSHSVGVGTPKYVAPEVVNGDKYNTMADIYSIGRITEELFDLDTISFNSIETQNTDLKEKFTNLNEMILSMTKTPLFRFRPTCAQVLDSFDSFEFDRNVIKLSPQFVPAIIRMNNANNQMFIDYLNA